MRILIVEDDLPSQLFMQVVLREYAPCEVAENGLQAVRVYIDAAVGGAPFDVVFMDIMMPEMDGLAAMDRIREFEALNPQSVPKRAHMVVVTATEDMQSLIHAYCSGEVYAFLKKPLESGVLQATMDTIIQAATGAPE